MANENEHSDDTLQVLEGSEALAAISRVEVDIAISTAKKYPRSVPKLITEIKTLVTLDEETAGSMHYALPRDGKVIEGPSIRFAEVAASCWGNVRHTGRVIAIDEKTLTAQGFCYDLEKNVSCGIEVRRRITGRSSRRYNEDMITTTGQAAVSIALRNAIFRVIPFALLRGCYEEARLASIGKTRTIAQRRANALAHFAKWGATPADVCLIADVKSVEDLDDEALIKLKGLATSIRENETTYDQVIINARGAPTVVTPDRVPTAPAPGAAGMTAADVAGGTTTEREPDDHEQASMFAEAERPAPPKPDLSFVTERPEPPAPEPEPEPAPAPSAPVPSSSVALCIQEIKTEVEARGVRRPLLEHLLQTHVGIASLDLPIPENTDTWTKLRKVLSAVRAIPGKGK